jgi:hypothetical protein
MIIKNTDISIRNLFQKIITLLQVLINLIFLFIIILLIFDIKLSKILVFQLQIYMEGPQYIEIVILSIK